MGRSSFIFPLVKKEDACAASKHITTHNSAPVARIGLYTFEKVLGA
jgi:hypothetical protein